MNGYDLRDIDTTPVMKDAVADEQAEPAAEAQGLPGVVRFALDLGSA